MSASKTARRRTGQSAALQPWLFRSPTAYRQSILLACASGISISSASLISNPAYPAAADDRDDVCALEAGGRHGVVRITDAETIVLDNGRSVRLIGALAPRAPLSAGAVKSWVPESRARAALSELVLGRQVDLAFGGRRIDRYGRLLAHVFVWRDGMRRWVQGDLLASGHARAYALPGSVACLEELLAHEKVARDTRAGLWALNHYRHLPPNKEHDLMRRRNSFQVVEGEVAAVAAVKGTVYINFGPNWRTDFTAAITTRALKAAKVGIEEITRLARRRVRVRGWIERRNGPYIELPHPDLLEILDQREEKDEVTPRLPEMARGRGGTNEDGLKLTPQEKKERPARRAPDATNL